MLIAGLPFCSISSCQTVVALIRGHLMSRARDLPPQPFPGLDADRLDHRLHLIWSCTGKHIGAEFLVGLPGSRRAWPERADSGNRGPAPSGLVLIL